MRVPVDELPFSLQELRAAAASRDLPALVARFVGEGRWRVLMALFTHAASPESATSLALAELDGAARALAVALDGLPAPRAGRAHDVEEMRAVRLAAADALLARSGAPPFGAVERRLRARAATLLTAAGDHHGAASLCEELGDHAGAAESWGALGELDRMEAAHARDDERTGARRAAADVRRQFDVLHTGGERRLAIAAAASLSDGLEDATATRQLAARFDARLVRARALTLRVRGAGDVRVAALPARLGRDPLAELPLRDPGISRLHAVVRDDGADLVLEDLGSRGGSSVGGARAAGPLALRGETEIAFGPTTVLRFSVAAASDAPTHAIVRGVAGLDRAFVGLVGSGPLDLALVIPGADGLALELGAAPARLVRRPDVAVRVAGHFLGAGCDLLHGDLIELPGAAGLTFEVV